MKAITSFQKFFAGIVSGSYPLMLGAALAMIWANLYPDSYHGVWHAEISFAAGPFHVGKSVSHWIDEALMALFFFSVGLEIKREVLVGELASIKKALLPVMAAAGGMLFPALIYLVFTRNTPHANGWGIPMATDIAFSLAVLAVLGKKIPIGVRIFLTALAIADDLGAVVVIGLFYTKTVSVQALLVALLLLVLLFLANLLWIRNSIVYAVLGMMLWMAVLSSGIHAAVAGVLVALFIPAKGKYETQTFIERIGLYLNRFECSNRNGNACGFTILLNAEHLNSVRMIEEACHEVETPLQRLEYGIHPWVYYLILPLFALANAGVDLTGIQISESLFHPVSLGIIAGLVIGKPLGILIFTFISVKVLRTELHKGVHWHHLIGAGILAGIGFTMSLFISGLSFASTEIMNIAKLGIIAGSTFSAFAGLTFLLYANRMDSR
ncbi:MAG: Na+/H+ antiporter NhaA [Desulfobacteraceae bacterium]|nr:MAG: Na+/H+ antiporter NhaA [Desulfobacteraceae bacterium]